LLSLLVNRGRETMEKATVKISGNEYDLRFTVGFWKKLKAHAGLTQQNLEKELNDDFGFIATEMVFWGILYGCGKDEASAPVTRQEIEAQLDHSVVDVIEQAVLNGMTKAEKRVVEIMKKQADKKLSEIEDKLGDSKKK